MRYVDKLKKELLEAFQERKEELTAKAHKAFARAFGSHGSMPVHLLVIGPIDFVEWNIEDKIFTRIRTQYYPRKNSREPVSLVIEIPKQER